MAFRGRGPELSNNSADNSNNNSNINRGNSYKHHYIHYWFRPRYIVYDKTFVIIDMIAMALVFVLCLCIYLFVYEIPVADVIAETKSTYVNCLFISIVISAILEVLACFLFKNKEKLVLYMQITLALFAIIFLVFLCIRLHLDNTYTEDKFIEIYEANEEKYSNSDINIHFGLDRIQLMGSKDTFVSENLSAYNQFKIKTTLELALYLLVMVVNIYLIFKITRHNEKINKVQSSDDVLFDDVQNVKY